jgi:hypothetical protein
MVIADYLIAVVSEFLSELRLDQGDPVTNSLVVLAALLLGIKRSNSYQQVGAQARVVAMVPQVPKQHVGAGTRKRIQVPRKSRKWRCRVQGGTVAGAADIKQVLVLMSHATDIHPEPALK